MRAGIALGSNVGDPLGNLKAARAEIERIAGAEPPLLASKIYERSRSIVSPAPRAF
jgi:7,8-dihydro-6-hydroxymethylpterin-pyrophosphokinase